MGAVEKASKVQVLDSNDASPTYGGGRCRQDEVSTRVVGGFHSSMIFVD